MQKTRKSVENHFAVVKIVGVLLRKREIVLFDAPAYWPSLQIIPFECTAVIIDINCTVSAGATCTCTKFPRILQCLHSEANVLVNVHVATYLHEAI